MELSSHSEIEIPEAGDVSAIRVVVPGEPVGQGRAGRAIRKTAAGKAYVQSYDPPKSRIWKDEARRVFRLAMLEYGRRIGLQGAAPPLVGPVVVEILAVFSCPRSAHRKRAPVGRRWHTSTPDRDNVEKAVMDAAQGILVVNDSQACDGRVLKIVGAQGELARVEVTVRPITSPTGA